MSKKLANYFTKEELYVDRNFKFGEIYYIKDQLIRIPQGDRVKDFRKIYDGRRIVIISNNEHNSDKFSPVISIAPLSSRTDLLRRYDIELEKGIDGVKNNSIIMMELIQPVCKADIERYCGIVRDEKKIAILDSILELIGQ